MFIRELGAVIALSMLSWMFTSSFDAYVTLTKIVYTRKLLFENI